LKQPSRKQTMTGGVLVFLLILGAYVVGFIGWGSPRIQASGSSVLVYNSEPIVTTCGASADNVKVYNLTTNSYSQILTESSVSIKDTSAISTEAATFNLYYGSALVNSLRLAVGINAIAPQVAGPLSFAQAQKTPVSLEVNVTLTGSDAGECWYVSNFRVWGIL